MSIINSQPLIGASGQGGYFLTKSLRFRSSASAYLNRTQGTSTNQYIGTWSFWAKRGTLGTVQRLFEGYTASSDTGVAEFEFAADNCFYVGGWTQNWRVTTQVFRDPSAWYHFVVVFDTTQTTANNRVKVYVNGLEVTSFSTTNNPAQNSTFGLNNNSAVLQIGRRRNVSNNDSFFDGYMTEINFIDGQALTPSSFGETSTSTGVWIPKKYTGTYGTNGFYLPFTDVATTSGSNAGLGKDFSGNGNYWTTNNISVTSGTTYDSMSDVPTLTSATTANYCVLNPLWKGSSITVDEANLKASATSLGSNQAVISSMFVSSGKWYFEYLQNTDSNSNLCVGIADTSFNATNNYVGGTATTYGYVAKSNYKFNNGSLTSYGSGSSANGDVLMCAFDLDNGKIYFGKNGTWYGSGDPAAGTNAAFTGISGTYCPAYSHNAGSSQSTSASFNFGQRPFAYTPPTGFKALNTFNLPTPTIGATASSQANKYFDATTYAGNNGTQSVTNSGSMQPDFVWVKNRTNAYTHLLYDSVRGVGTLKAISSSETTAEGGMNDNSTFGYLSALNSNGFTVVSGSTANSYTNSSSNNYIGWQWKANGSGSSNTAGSITSTVSANTTAGFSIVTYTGTGANATVGHGLGVAPSFIITKRRDSSASGGNWYCYHTSLGTSLTLVLNGTNAQISTANSYQSVSSSNYGIGTNGDMNTSSGTYVAYCFAQVAGYSAFGSYTGNGSNDGTFVYTGFRPRFILIKESTPNARGWRIFDTARNPYNQTGLSLAPNASDAEDNGSNLYNQMDILSNGFKLRAGTNSEPTNESGATYIYAAFAESPFKFSNAR